MLLFESRYSYFIHLRSIYLSMADPNLNQEILIRAKDFFRDNIVNSHIIGGLERASKLEEYNIHPFLFKYLANFLEGDASPRSIAKALIYPRILGTSITTIFGMRAQQMINELFEGLGSTTPGIDIEFIDKLDGRKKYCQLKSGPNNINKGDVKTILDHFRDARNLARTNNVGLGANDLVLGVIYGEHIELSGHYLVVEKDYPVFTGKEFWHRLTGQPDFYFKLIEAIGEVVLEVDGRERLEAAITALAAEISARSL